MDEALDREGMRRVLGRMKEWEREQYREEVKKFEIDIDGKNNVKLLDIFTSYIYFFLLRC